MGNFAITRMHGQRDTVNTSVQESCDTMNQEKSRNATTCGEQAILLVFILDNDVAQ